MYPLEPLVEASASERTSGNIIPNKTKSQREATPVLGSPHLLNPSGSLGCWSFVKYLLNASATCKAQLWGWVFLNLQNYLGQIIIPGYRAGQ